MPRRWGVALLLVACVAEAHAAPSFAPPVVIPAAATRVAAGDLNGDGHVDLVTLDAREGVVASVLLNDGTGRFGTRLDLVLPIVARWLGIAQVAGSASPDLVLVSDDGEISILTGDGAGQFQDSGLGASVGPLPGGLAAAALADLDGDGRDDLVVAYGSAGVADNAVFRLFQQVAGGFGDPATVDTVAPSIGVISGIALADLTGDGHRDLIVHLSRQTTSCGGGNFNFQGTLRVLANDGAGALATVLSGSSGAGANPALAAADMDGDGLVDLVLSSQFPCSGLDIFVVLENGGSTGGTWNGFASTHTTFGFLDPWAIETADVDADGQRDVIALAFSPFVDDATWMLRIHRQTEGLAFEAPVDRPVGLRQPDLPPGNILLADVNGDGKPDVLVPVDGESAVPSNFPDSVVLFLNTAATAAVGGNARLTVTPAGPGSGTVTSTSPAGISCGAGATACSLLLPVGPPATTVTLTAAAAAGSTFTGWSGGGCAGTGECVVSVDANRTVVAFFALTSELGAPVGTPEWKPAGVSVSFINVGTGAFNLAVSASGSPYTETSVVRVNGVNQATTPLFSGAGANLKAFVEFTALPPVTTAPTAVGVTVLNGLPSGPFSLSPSFPLHVVRGCRGSDPEAPCVREVTAVPSPADANAVAFTVRISAASDVFEEFPFEDFRVNGAGRPTTPDESTCTDSFCSAILVDVRFADIVAGGALLLSTPTGETQRPAVGTFTIRPPVQISVASPLPGGTVGAAYGTTITAIGGSAAKAWAVTGGTLPPDLQLAEATGLLQGTPTTAGTFEFTITVTDTDFPAATASKAFALTIAAAPVITTASPLPASTQGAAYAQVTLEAAGGTGSQTWTVSAGALPAGMALSAAGVVSGTPTASGTFNFTAQVTDAVGAVATKALAVTINAPPSITTASLPGGTAGATYPTQTLAATGGTGARTWSLSAGALPGGLALSATEGTIGGTPTAAGTFNFTVKVTDGVGATATKALSIVIAADTGFPTVTIQSPAPPKATVTATPGTVSGTASDNAAVTQVSWANDRGGSGAAAGTTAWTAGGIPLQPGKNVITVTARDAANNTATAQVALYFFQDALSVGTTPVRAVHFLQLATAIENLRTRLGFPGPAGFEWTGTPPAPGGLVRASHLNDLRAALGALYDHAGIAVGTTFTRTPIAAGARIDAAHVGELRTAIRTLP